MPIHKERRIIACPRDYFFDIIADVERYPEYLSFWQDAKIYRHDKNVYYTVQKIGIGPVTEVFRTKTNLIPTSKIRVTSTDHLFREFDILWVFESISERSCQVDFEFRCEASSFIMRRLMNLMLDEAAQHMVQAFQDRAIQRYTAMEAKERARTKRLS